MKLRVIREKKGDYTPQHFNEERNRWEKCYLDNSLVSRLYWNIVDAIEDCKKYKELFPDPEVVWEEES